MDAKAYAARNRQGSDWFTHSAEPALQNDKAPVTDAPPQSKVQLIKPVCNSNQWFKHADDKDAPRHPEGENKTVSKHEDGISSSACAAWCIGGGEARGQEVESRSRVVTKEGEAYCLRDKSSSDWFSHDPNNSSKGHSTPSHRMGSSEGCQNASRMRGESENWFSHDPNAPAEPLHSSKGRPSSKVQGTDMYSVFHHDQ